MDEKAIVEFAVQYDVFIQEQNELKDHIANLRNQLSSEAKEWSKSEWKQRAKEYLRIMIDNVERIYDSTEVNTENNTEYTVVCKGPPVFDLRVIHFSVNNDDEDPLHPSYTCQLNVE